ncbi:MAG: hypothetical protein NVS9B10_29880 [Nevskia sp.]
MDRLESIIEIQRLRDAERGHGLEHLDRDRAAVDLAADEPGAQALQHEAHEILQRGLVALAGGLRVEGALQQDADIERQAAFDQDAQHAECGAAQRERVLARGRFLADREDAGEGVELVGERDDLALARRRDRRASLRRAVVFGDCSRYCSWFARAIGVVTAH